MKINDIVFMGTPDFAAGCLQTLLDSFSKSATTSAGREIGRQLTRGLLGIFGIGKKR